MWGPPWDRGSPAPLPRSQKHRLVDGDTLKAPKMFLGRQNMELIGVAGLSPPP
jgi:hypothetical protein